MTSPRLKTFNYAIGMFGTSIPINMLKTYAAKVKLIYKSGFVSKLISVFPSSRRTIVRLPFSQAWEKGSFVAFRNDLAQHAF